MILEAGCGKKRAYTDSVAIDIDKNSSADVIADAALLPFKESAFHRVEMNSVLEHVSDSWATMLDVHRVLKPGGTAWVSAPHASSILSTFGHLQHKRGFTYFTFSHEECTFYWNVKKAYIHYVGGSGVPQTVGFLKKKIFLLIERLANRFPSSFERLWSYWVGGAEYIEFELEKKPVSAKGN